MRRAVRVAGLLLTAGGVLVLLDVAVTLLWQEPLSALGYHHDQARARTESGRIWAAAEPPQRRRELDRGGRERRIAAGARALRRLAPDGDGVGTIRIERIGLDAAVVRGSSAAALARGPGIYDGSPFPGERGTVAIAGHRTTHGAPFRRLDELRRGDRIVLRMPYARISYGVERTRIVDADAFWILKRRAGADRLVLSACHPLYSAAQRIVVFARRSDA